MKVSKLRLICYRNYQELNLSLSDNINIFLGMNAQGKTNIIEAVYDAAIGGSYRTNSDSDLIMWNQDGGSIAIDFQRLGVDNKLDFVFKKGHRRQILYNGHSIKGKELIGNINMVLFSPEDLFLIKGAPAQRRQFLDAEISQASPSYYVELMKYNKILQQRNSLLKKIKEHKASFDMLSVWDPQLANSGAKIVVKRMEAVKKLNMLANLMQRRISGNKENLSLSYQIKGLEGDNQLNKMEKLANFLEMWYNKTLTQKAEEDMWRGSTSVGPQRDDIAVQVNGIDLRAFGSQGQQRTGVLALKLSELEFIRSETGEYPILLLDDVMSELDGDRRSKLLEFIRRENIQTLITATDKAYFPNMSLGKYYHVSAGVVTEG